MGLKPQPAVSRGPDSVAGLGSIKQIAEAQMSESRRCAIPDFRNMGTMVRMIGVVNLMMLVTALIRSSEFSSVGWILMALAGYVEMPLIFTAILLYVLGPWMIQLSWAEVTAVLCGLGMLVALLIQTLFLPPLDMNGHVHMLLWTLWAALTVAGYFRWRQIEQMPALEEARILALTSRIRPHFFFNSLNGVLGVIRSDPKQAEQALESLAELFRELMKDKRELVPLHEEIELCNRYLDLERLRLGERLQIKWEVKRAPLGALVPPLMLQPLIENAVYHGIEPSAVPGTILVGIVRKGDILDFVISNPQCANARRSQGNHMALGNIRERLRLFFDMEAALTTEAREDLFIVRIRMPLRKEKK